MIYFTIQHYNVPKGFSVPEDELRALDKKFMPKFADLPIARMEVAALCVSKFTSLDSDIKERDDFMRWYISRYCEDTEWGRKYTTLKPAFFPDNGKRYLAFDEATGRAEVEVYAVNVIS